MRSEPTSEKDLSFFMKGKEILIKVRYIKFISRMIIYLYSGKLLPRYSYGNCVFIYIVFILFYAFEHCLQDFVG